MLHDVSIERVDLRVADIPRAEAFYAHLAGGPVPMAFLSDGVRGERSPRPAAGLFHTAIRFSTREALGAALVRMRDAEYRLTGASDHGVSEALYLDDPDGNGVELYWDRPREAWPEAMFTEPLPLEPLLEGAADGGTVDIGHVHYKAGDLQAATRFWLDLGMELQASVLDQAAFLSADGYHHHVGLNNWYSNGLSPQPRDLPGLERVVIRGEGAEPGEREEPCGTIVELVA
jgi:catechol 2,3-dioxygenase